jgi:hypothetical protein
LGEDGLLRIVRQDRIAALVWLALVAPLAGSAARADERALTVDLRATSTSSGTILDPKHVLFTGGPGDTVTMDVYSVITGAVDSDPDNDWLDYLHGSFLTSFGGLRGDLKADLVMFYADFIAFDGLRQDLDGDGDLDVGSNNEASIANYFRAYRWRNAPREAVAKIATLTWTSTGTSGDTSLFFRGQNVDIGAQWVIDATIFDPSFGQFLGGAPVQISAVPEPAPANTLLGLGLGICSALRQRGGGRRRALHLALEHR